MDRTGLLLGGFVLLAGGVAYYYLATQQQNGNGNTGCTQYTNQSECEQNGCYWYDSSCHSSPQGWIPCSNLNATGTGCYPQINGWQKCDAYDNLCRCNGTDYYLVQSNSIVCKDNILYHKCAPQRQSDETYKMTCSEFWGYGGDECDSNIGWGHGCSCAEYPCKEQSFCEPRDSLCVIKAQYSPWQGLVYCEESDMQCWKDGDSCNACFYPLPSTVSATQITGTLWTKWGPWPTANIGWSIYGYYKGEIQLLCDGEQWCGTDCEIPITKNFECGPTSLEGLIFVSCKIPGVNIHPTKFHGTLSYM